MPNTSGLVLRKGFNAPEDAEIVRNMRNAGAILLCTTNTSELCMWLESGNRVYGITRNPYNLSRYLERFFISDEKIFKLFCLIE